VEETYLCYLDPLIPSTGNPENKGLQKPYRKDKSNEREQLLVLTRTWLEGVET